MPAARHPIIAREGWPALTITAGAGGLLYWAMGAGAAAPAILLFGLLLYLARDPHREPPSLPLAMVSPLYGRVAAAGEAYDPWLGRDALCLEVRCGLLDVHSIYSPTEGKIVEQWTRPRHAREPEAANRHAIAYQIRTDEGDDVVMEIVQGALRGTVRIGYQPGERVGHARRIGFAPLGLSVVLYVPPGSRLDVAVGKRAVAASTVLATFVHEQAVSSIGEAGTD